jgi:hypothetical protein
MEAQQGHSLQYFLASLAGIARALEDFGYADEAGQLASVRRSLESKAARPQPDSGMETWRRDI